MKTNRQTKKSEPYEKEEKKSYFPLSRKERRQNACTQRRFPHIEETSRHPVSTMLHFFNTQRQVSVFIKSVSPW